MTLRCDAFVEPEKKLGHIMGEFGKELTSNQ